MNKITAESGIEIAITENSFTKAGWTFSGWNTKSDGTGAPYNDKTKITLTADLTLYAQWAAGTGTAYKVEHWQQNIADDEYTLAKTEPMTGTTGEETAAKAEETAGFSAKEFVQEKIAADGSTVVKILYDRKIITLTFDADNGEDKTTLSGKFGAEIISPTPEKADFNFNGWSTDKIPNESSKLYNGKEKITLTEDLTLYAQWKEISYKINYELNGGTNASENPATFKKRDNVILKEPTYEYFDFCGWYLTKDFSGEAITGWNAGEKTGDITLYAKWAVTVKAENIVNIIENLPKGTHNICVVGEIDDIIIYNISAALRSNENAKVNLDLSKTTGLENIPYEAFYDCSNLADIKIPQSVTSIYDYAFKDCTNLTTIEIPSSVTRIGSYAFWNCTSLTNIKISETVTNIGDCAFGGCCNVTSLHIENDNKYYQAFNNCLYTKDGKVLINVLGNPSSITFLQSITSIGDCAFYECTNLTNIEVPKSVTSIGKAAFWSCTSLTSIKIPEGVTSIGNATFYRCTNLTNIEIPESVISIGDSAFNTCKNLTTIKIPSSVINIGYYAFIRCTSLTSIKIPEGVTSIGYYAFMNCTNLSTVKYMGTIEQWNSISVDGSDNKNLTSAKIICTDGVINE